MTMNSYDLYGLASGDLEELRPLIEKLLGVKFVAHESSYYDGGYYRTGPVGEENFVLMRNFKDEEGIHHEPFADVEILFYANRTSKPEQIESILKSSALKFRLLSRKQL